jgi:predicted dinucleotide-binding enzyme
MKIGILGAGNVGGTLGQGWARRGHEILFGVRDPQSPKTRDLIAQCGDKARAGSAAEAATCEVVVNALPFAAGKEALEALNLKGKVLLDCANPLKSDLSGLEIGPNTSAGEMAADWAKGAKVVKIFISTGYNNMANPDYGGNPLTMFYCGDDPAAKGIAADLARDLGFTPVDAGPLTNARLLEPLAMLWIWLAIRGGMQREFGFRLVTR